MIRKSIRIYVAVIARRRPDGSFPETGAGDERYLLRGVPKHGYGTLLGLRRYHLNQKRYEPRKENIWRVQVWFTEESFQKNPRHPDYSFIHGAKPRPSRIASNGARHDPPVPLFEWGTRYPDQTSGGGVGQGGQSEQSAAREDDAAGTGN